MSFTNIVTYQNSSLGQKDPGFVRAVPGNINKRKEKHYTSIPASVHKFFVSICLNNKVSIGFLKKNGFCHLKTKQNKYQCAYFTSSLGHPIKYTYLKCPT